MEQERAEEPHDDLKPLLHNRLVQWVQRLYPRRILHSRSGIRLARFVKRLIETEPHDVPGIARKQDMTVPGPEGDIPVRQYVPQEADDQSPCLLYFHGGGWVTGSLDSIDATCQHLAATTDCTLISVDYRLAPEHPYPAAFDDCYAVTSYVSEHPDEFGIDPDRIAVAGSSAGGNLAAAVALAARDRGGPELAHQVLVYPALARQFDTESYRQNKTGYILGRNEMQRFWSLYLQSEDHDTDPYAVPLQASSLEELPPATIITAGYDPLRDDGYAYAEALEAAGVPVRHEHFPAMIHGFVDNAYEYELERGFDALSLIADRLRTCFSEKGRE